MEVKASIIYRALAIRSSAHSLPEAPIPPQLVVAQSGGPTAVVNASLVGVIREALGSKRISSVLGSRHGVEGLLRDELLELSTLSAEQLGLLAQTPSAALGSSRHKLTDDEAMRVVEVFRRLEVRYFCCIGGNDSADTALRIHQCALDAGYELLVVGVPKTIDNDLPETDHCPGYGSAARFVALAAQAAGLDTEAMRRNDPFKIVEVMGRNAGWLAAAAALAHRQPQDAPHLIYLPERPLAVDLMVQQVASVYQRLGYCVAVMCENQPGPDGRVLGAGAEPVFVDAFGHAYHDSPARYFARVVTSELGLRARYDRPGSLQRMLMATVSTTDLAEADQVGRAAVRAALAGLTAQMVALRRESGPRYVCNTDCVPLEKVANRERRLPDVFINPDGSFPSAEFVDYALPLIGEPLPTFARL